jgi:tripartite-type tricarboxylate transporter receptor subunit TctC
MNDAAFLKPQNLVVADQFGEDGIMKLPRRKFLRLTAGSAALSIASSIAMAEVYPSRPVRIVVCLPAGSGSDVAARLMGQRLAEQCGQPFVIDNRPGASGNIGTETVVRAPSDGYTLLMIGTFNAINAILYDKLNFNFMRDITPVAIIDRSPLVMVVNPSIPAGTVPEFIAYARANPGKINMASGGNGTVTHLAGELFGMMAAVDMAHVPYHGSYLPDLLGGQVQVVFSPIPTSIESIRVGKLRALAVTTTVRSQALPDIPSMSEFVPGYEAIFWDGIGAPSNTSPEIIDELHKEINAALADPTLKTRLTELGYTVFTSSPAEFGEFIADQTERWANVIRTAKIKVE